MQTPSQFKPETAAQFIGGAAKVGKVLETKARALRETESGTMKVLLYGVPGVGKTAIAQLVATIMAGTKWNIEQVNGRSLNIDLVREWQRQSHFRSMYGGITVKLVDELDTAPTAAQDLLLTFLDTMKDGWAFIGTSNVMIGDLTPRLQTRLQHYKVEAPETNELSKFIAKIAKVPAQIAAQIAVGSGGNVRAALLDLESYLDVKACA